MNNRTSAFKIDLNVTARGEPIDVRGFTRMHYQPRVVTGGTLSSAVLEFKRSIFVDGPDLESFSTAETITASEFNTPTITEGVDVSDAAYVWPVVTTAEGSAAEAQVAYYLTDEDWDTSERSELHAGGSFPTTNLYNGRRFHRTDKGRTYFYDDGSGIAGDIGKAVWVAEDVVTGSYGENQLTTGADALRPPNGNPGYGYAPTSDCFLCFFSVQNGQAVTGTARVQYGSSNIYALAMGGNAAAGGTIDKASWVEVTYAAGGNGFEVTQDAPSVGAWQDASAVVGWREFIEA